METNRESFNAAVAAARNVKERDYWLDKLSGELEKTSFPYDFKKAALPERIQDEARFVITGEIFSRLMNISNKADVRLYLLLLAGVVVMINKYTDRTDIITGTSIYKQDIEGDLINTILALRTPLTEQVTFKELLLQARQVLAEATEHQDYPFDKLLHQLNLPVPHDEFPLFDIVVLLENIHEERYVEHTRPNILFSFIRNHENIEGVIKFNSSMYKKETVERMGIRFICLLKKIIFNVDVPLSNFDIITEEEKTQLLVELNATESAFPQDKTISELFEEQVKRTPDSLALVFEYQQLTYGELNKKANQLARLLSENGSKCEDIVALLMGRSLEMVIAILAVWKTGRAYLPVDLDYPANRIEFMIKDNNARIALTQKSFWINNDRPFLLLSPGKVIDLDDGSVYSGDTTNLPMAKHPDPLAYIIYTSGTTGKPKGVMVGHTNAVNTLWWFGKRYKIQPGKRILQLTNYTFDPSVEQIFGSLIHGGTCCLVSSILMSDIRQLRQYIDDNRINIVNYTPQMLNELFCTGDKCESIEVIISGGEKLEESLKDRFLDRGYELYNQYGPTETTIDALSGRCSPGMVTLGKPISNYNLYILNKNNKLMPPGLAGELYIGGAGVSRGYLNSPQLTMEKFISNPFSEEGRIYRTGDRARWLPGGEVEYLGRFDGQVKIRGVRIELGEIESHLAGLDDIGDSVVVVRENEKKEKYLCCYFVSPRKPDVQKIKNTLFQGLPRYMIPAYFMQLDEFPKTPGGKVDRRRLSISDDFRAEPQITYVEPGTDVEKLIVKIWTEVLTVDKIGIHDNFFELGGNSLNIIQLNNKLKESFNKDIPVAAIFDYPSVSLMAQFLNEQEQNSTKRTDFEISVKGDKIKNVVQKIQRIKRG